MTVGLFAGSTHCAGKCTGQPTSPIPRCWLSFVMWGLYVVMLFVRRSTGLRGRRAVYLSSAVFVVMLCVWAANLLQLRPQVQRPMKILLTGLNHKTAPVELRERLAIAPERCPAKPALSLSPRRP